MTTGPKIPATGPSFTVTVNGAASAAIEACRKSLARESYLHFVQYMFQAEGRTLQIGRHTQIIAERIDRALTDAFEYGKSTYLRISVPFRHGKSDLASRFLSPYIIGKYGTEPYRSKFNKANINPIEFILATYASNLSDGFSRDARAILQRAAYRELFSNAALSKEVHAAEAWQAVDTSRPDGAPAKMYSLGISGGATGKGSVLLDCDDLIKNREEAESSTIRDKAWNSFKDDFMTRLASVHIVLLIGTRWHVDDVIGRVRACNDPADEKYDAEFPIFEAIEFKAMEDDGSYLFPEKYPESWYKMQFATLGAYSAAALLQGDPIAKGGNLLPTDKIEYWDAVPPSLAIQERLSCRAWDLASSAKELSKDDPDWTAGPRGFIFFDDSATKQDDEDTLRGKAHFIITDCRCVRTVAGPRNELIVSTAKTDGALCWQAVESVAGYKDAATTLTSLLKGISVVHKVSVHRDKYTRIEVLHPLIDAGRMAFVRGPWNLLASQQMSQFPGGKHDDIPDAIATLYTKCLERAIKALRSGYFQAAGAAGRGWVDIDDEESSEEPHDD